MTFFEPKRPAVGDVFTPRRTDVNRDIYVDRPDLEKELRRSLLGSLHTIVFGESGSGKSWLYKKVLGDMNAYFKTANSANALRFGSISEELAKIVDEDSPRRLVEQTEEMNATAKALVAEGGLKSERKYQIAVEDSVLACFELLRRKAGSNPAVLVIDNLELIFTSPERMDELASIVTLLDDSRYAKFQVKLLIVGVPSNVKEYLSRTFASVANRIAEISEVASLSEEEVFRLVEKGFFDLLKVTFLPGVLVAWQRHVARVTMGFAQHVQEYCEQLGYVVEDAGWMADAKHLDQADAQWLKQGLSQASGIIAPLMNEKETKVGRRNQVLFALGGVTKRVFNAPEVEQILRSEFPQSTADTTLAVGQILSELAADGSIIRRSAKGSSYEFRDARFAMALRVLLRKDEVREKVTKLD